MKEFANIKASLIPYNQDEVEQLMKQLLFKNGVTDVQYPGSNVSQLTSVISYAISSLNVNTAINLQETILPLATKRMNVLMGARELGYEPSQKLSYKYKLTIKPKYSTDPAVMIQDPAHPNDPTKLIPDTTNDAFKFNYTIEPYTAFENSGKTYYYTGKRVTIKDISNFDIQNINNSQGKPKDEVLSEIEVIEGVFTPSKDHQELQISAIDYQENGVQKTKQDYLIPFSNLEENEGIKVYLTYVDKNGATVVREEWDKSEQFLIDDSLDYNKNKFIRMQNIILGYPAVFFEFAGLGQGIRSKTIIEVDILESSGSDGEAKGEFTLKDSRASEIFAVEKYEETQVGTEEETINSIKENAIVFHNTGNRAVTRLDYIAIAKRHGLVAQADAWGGEEETPKQKGEIWLSCTPESQTRPVSESYATGTQTFVLETGTNSEDKKDDKDDQHNWRNWYLTGPEQKTLIEYLDNFKIMTMGINYRHPLYIDFEYDMNVVKYDMHKTPEDTNKQLFDTMNKYFINNIESFESEYLNSNMQRILDTALEYKSGINYSLKMYGVLNEKMIDTFNLGLSTPVSRLIVNVAWPFENLLPNGISGDIEVTKLPKIDTISFGKIGKKLEVTYADLTGKTGTVREIDIKLDGAKVGTYRVDIKKNIIELDFEMNPKNRTDFFGAAVNGVSETARFEIAYPPYDVNLTNAAFAKNIIPRLKKVNFNY